MKIRGQLDASLFDRVICVLLYGLIIVVPLIFWRDIGIVFSLTKITVARILVLLMLFTWGLKYIWVGHRFVRTSLDWWVLSYLLVVTAATFHSIHFLTSLNGFYGRYEGLTTLYLCGILFFVVTNFIRDRKQVVLMMVLAIVAAFLMSLYGVIQRLGWDPYVWGGVDTKERVIGTIGQPNFLAAYLAMGILLLLYFFFFTPQLAVKIPNGLVWGVKLFSFMLLFSGLLFTTSRGGLIGYLGGFLIFCLFIGKEGLIQYRKQMVWVVVMMVFLLGGTLLLPTTTAPLQRLAEEAIRSSARATPAPYEYGNNKPLQYNAMKSRIETWRSGWKMVEDHPWFGIGPETMKLLFPRYETEHFRFYEGFHVKQDRNHNEVMDVAVTRGLLGLISYVAMLVALFWGGVQAMRRSSSEDRVLLAVLLAAIAAYLLQNQFSFSVVAISTFFWILMGGVVILALPDEEEKHVTKLPVRERTVPRIILSLVMLLVVTTFAWGQTYQIRADRVAKQGEMLAEVGNLEGAEEAFQQSIRISPYEEGVWIRLALLHLNYLQRQDHFLQAQFDQAVNVVLKGMQMGPYSADFYYVLGRLFLYGATHQRPAMLPQAITAFSQGLLVDPYYAELYYGLGESYRGTGESKQAAKAYERAYFINPNMGQAISAYVTLAVAERDLSHARQTLEKCLQKYPGAPGVIEGIGETYFREGDFRGGIRFYEQQIALYPEEPHYDNQLGVIYAQLGAFNEAERAYRKALAIDFKNVEALGRLGVLYLQRGDRDMAQSYFQQVLAIDPNNALAKKYSQLY